MATEKWVAGAVSTWTDLFGSELNSLTNQYSVLSSVVFDNTTAMDMFALVSFYVSSMTPSGSGINLQLYRYDLTVSSAGNADGTVYGDGLWTSAASGTPNAGWITNCPLTAATGVVDWTTDLILLKPNKSKFLLRNNAGVNLPSSGTHISIKTFNRAVS